MAEQVDPGATDRSMDTASEVGGEGSEFIGELVCASVVFHCQSDADVVVV